MRKSSVCGSGKQESAPSAGNAQSLPQYVSVVGVDWCKGNVAYAYRDEGGAPVIVHKAKKSLSALIAASPRVPLWLVESSFASGIADGDEYNLVLKAIARNNSALLLVSPRATPRRLERAGYKTPGKSKSAGKDGFDAFVTLLHYEEHPEAFYAPKQRRRATAEEAKLRRAYLIGKANQWRLDKYALKTVLPKPAVAPEFVGDAFAAKGAWATSALQVIAVAKFTATKAAFDTALGMYENAYPSPYRADMMRRVRYVSKHKSLSKEKARALVRRAARWIRTQVCGSGNRESAPSAGKYQSLPQSILAVAHAA